VTDIYCTPETQLTWHWHPWRVGRGGGWVLGGGGTVGCTSVSACVARGVVVCKEDAPRYS